VSELKLVVCDWSNVRSCTMHGSDIDRVIAALSADPATIDELSEAFVRFMRPSFSDEEETNCSRNTRKIDSSKPGEPDPRKSQLRNWLCMGLNDEPYDAGLVVIDLAAKLVVVESTYSSHAHRGHIHEHLPDRNTTRFLAYHIDKSWKFLNDATDWQCQAQQRRSERTQDGLDTRSVLYGEPMLEFIARSCLEHWHRREQIAAEMELRLSERWPQDGEQPHEFPISEIFHDLFREIHAAWLLMPLAELNGKSSREVLVEQQDHISFDLDDRYHQWSAQGRCPPPLSTQAYAYRFAGFGTAENVLYYHLIRSLLARCWGDLESEVARIGEILDQEPFVRSEIAQLALYRDEWFDQPDNGFFGKSPRWFCDRERRRLPAVVDGSETMPDCDCPLCQMMADSSAPMLIGLDGSDLDDEFVFDFSCPTQADWDRKQANWRATNERIEAGIQARNELGLPTFPPFEPVAAFDDDEWDWNADQDLEASQSAVESPRSLELCLFEVGAELADVIVGLRGTRNEFRELRLPDIECLNHHFATLREACGLAKEPISSSLLKPVIDRFRDDLYRIAETYPEIAESCDMVLVKLDEFPELD